MSINHFHQSIQRHFDELLRLLTQHSLRRKQFVFSCFEQSEQLLSMPSRIFHELLAQVGDHHCYQGLVTVFCTMINMESALVAQVNAFLFYQQPYQCPDSITNCHQFVCSLPQEQQQQYLHSSFDSMVSQFGNYRCNEQPLVYAQMIIYFGGTVGALVSMGLLSFLTQRRVMMVSITMCIIGASITVLSSSLPMATVGMFIAFIGRRSVSELVLSFSSETIGESIRVECQTVISVMYSAGSIICAVSYWLIKPWQLSMILSQLVPLVVLLVLTILVLEQTPMELVTSFPSERAISGFRKIARINGTQCNINEAEIAAVREQYDDNARNHQHQNITILDLFCFKSLTCLTITCFLLRFLFNFISAGSKLMIRDFSMNIFVAGIVVMIPGLLSGVVGLFTYSKVPRKVAYLVCSITGVIICVLVVIFASCPYNKTCSDTQTVFQSIGLVLYKLVSIYAFNLFLINSSELFPSQVKPLSSQLLSCSSSLAVVAVPPVQSFLQNNNLSVFIAFGIGSFLITFLALGLKETLNIKPPEMIQELEYRKQQQQDP